MKRQTNISCLIHSYKWIIGAAKGEDLGGGTNLHLF